jgi:hypothetical protein
MVEYRDKLKLAQLDKTINKLHRILHSDDAKVAPHEERTKFMDQYIEYNRTNVVTEKLRNHYNVLSKAQKVEEKILSNAP